MQLMIRQRVFSWTDSYDVYDEAGSVCYTVKGEFFSLGRQLHVYDRAGRVAGMVKQKLMTILPVFEIEIGGVPRGRVNRKFSMFRPRYEVDFMGWRADGDFLGWQYDVYEACSLAVRVSKKLLSWGDTYVIEYGELHHELPALMLVLAIDAANCSSDSDHGLFNT